MNWFRNLNATPRLMSSFGIMIILALAVGCLGINSLSKANERIGVLYNADLKGTTYVSDITIARLSLGRQGRDAILRINDPVAVAADERAMLSDFTKMRAGLEGAEGTFYTPGGKAMLATIRRTLPAYEKAYHDMFERIDARDIHGAMTALAGLTPVGQPLFDAADQARALKGTLAEEKFEVSNQEYQTARTLMIGVVGVALIFGLILSFVIARGFAVPLRQAVIALEQVAEGDLTAKLDVSTTDEVGRMASALNAAVERLNSTMQEVANTASNASASSQELASAAEAIASGAQQQAASLEETSASLEQITASVRQSADNAQQASQLAVGSKDSAMQGQEVVAKAITAMTEINAASAKISDIISTIDEIAFQTNLLAVNAAVEAARAGDEGRGFAVVASEVRSLAQRSALAAKEIKVLIQDSLRKVDAGSGLVDRSGETLQGIVGSVKRVTDIVGEIAASSAEQSTGVEQVNTAMTQMDMVTQSNSAQTEELSATAHSLSEQAGHLLNLVSAFTLNRPAKGARDRKSHSTSTNHAVGAGLVQSAKSNLAHSTPRTTSLAKRAPSRMPERSPFDAVIEEETEIDHMRNR